ncbi:MAG: methionyl-tRNA formyltransferase [Lachnospiraceae bacterium]|nr:methionyl-tRNA formyltransferase [Lachnospiraceae bacterium]
MRIVFMGTPDFSVPVLEALIGSHHQVVGVVTQPDKPKGRGKAIQMSPVKETALRHGLSIYQPVRARDAAFIEEMRRLKPEVMVVIAFGQILSKEFLEVPVHGCINIHASLLPKYRGSAPIQWAVINGERESGITTMMMDEGIDTGDMLEKRAIVLDEKETGGSLFDRLSLLGGELILSTLEKLEAGTLPRTPQNHQEATYVKKIPKSLGEIDWSMDATAIERLIRGLNPWPSAYTWLNGKMLKLWAADVLPEGGKENRISGKTSEEVKEYSAGDKRQKNVGVIVAALPAGLQIQTGNGILNITSLQLEGKKRMDTGAFLRGFPVQVGMRFGNRSDI